MTHRILLVDDESLARDRVRRLLEEYQHFQCVAEQPDGEEAIAWLSDNPVDLVLLDIEMPGLNGLETARRINELPNPPLIIFCTAHDNHALEAFGVEAIDYLMKPIRREDLGRALNRALSRLGQSASTGGPDESEQPVRRTHLSARTHMGLQLIPIEQVFYFQADQKYVNVVHHEGETLIDDSLRQLETEFGDQFVRVHRSALVARQLITRLENLDVGGHKVYLKGLDEGVSVSRRHLADVRKVMKSL